MLKERGLIISSVMNRIEKSVPNTIFFIRDFLELGSPETIRKIFFQAVLSNKLVRISKGIYIKPKLSKFGVVPPSLEDIAVAVAKRDNCEIIPTGYTAANILGISTQIPMHITYITSGTSRTLKIGNKKIIFKHRMPRNFASKGMTVPILVHGIKEVGLSNLSETDLISIKRYIEKSADPYFESDLLTAPGNIRSLIQTLIDTKEK